MATQSFNQQGDVHFATRKRSSDNQLPSNLDHSADGFDIWWNRTFALHAAVLAQASALKRTYQRVRSTEGARAGQAH